MQDNHLTTLLNTVQEALDFYVTLTTVKLHIMYVCELTQCKMFGQKFI